MMTKSDRNWVLVLLAVTALLAASGGFMFGDLHGWDRRVTEQEKRDCEQYGRGVWFDEQETCLRCPEVKP